MGVLALQLGRDHEPGRGGVIARKEFGLDRERNAPELFPAPELHQAVGLPLRRAFWQWQATGLLEDRTEFSRLDVDGRVVAPRDLGEWCTAHESPGRIERQIVVDGDGHDYAAACS